MYLPARPKKLDAYSANGIAVRHAHHLQVCLMCWEDYMDGEESGNDDHLLLLSRNEDEIKFVMGVGEDRFMPQWDKQILGPAKSYKIQQDYNNPAKPLPLSALKLHQCGTCNLTWLIGEAGEAAGKSHPSHHTLSSVLAGTLRSLVVSVDGACSSNGATNPKAGIGAHFGPASKYNISEAFTLQGTATNQRAELHAVARALEVVCKQVMPQRELEVKAATKNPDGHLVYTRLIVATDSSYVVEGMCSHFKNWTAAKGGLVNKKKKVVANSDGFLRIQREVQALSKVGVQVLYYHIGREENLEADRLAKAAIMMS